MHQIKFCCAHKIDTETKIKYIKLALDWEVNVIEYFTFTELTRRHRFTILAFACLGMFVLFLSRLYPSGFYLDFVQKSGYRTIEGINLSISVFCEKFKAFDILLTWKVFDERSNTVGQCYVGVVLVSKAHMDVRPFIFIWIVG